jgi:hypothetical protein
MRRSSCDLRRALRPAREQSPSSGGKTETDQDREAQHCVRHAAPWSSATPAMASLPVRDPIGDHLLTPLNVVTVVVAHVVERQPDAPIGQREDRPASMCP